MKVKLIPPNSIYSEIESVPLAMPILEKYFENIKAHDYGITTNNFKRNTASFYCGYICDTEDASIPKINFDLDISHTSALRDFYSRGYPLKNCLDLGYKIEDMYEITIKNRLAGFLIGNKNNILIASDWTHCDGNIPILGTIIEVLAEKGLLTKIPKKTKKVRKLTITLGCDPELEQLTHSTTYTPISTTIPFSTTAEIGVDGSGLQIELRPEASPDPDVLMSRIKKLISQLPPVGIVGNKFSLGGHIHIGGIRPTTALIHLLDDFIGKLSIKTSGKARGSYNHLSAYEMKSYGFEYRTPSSTWLYNPNICRITLKLVKNLIRKAYSDDGIEYSFDSTGIPTMIDYEKLLSPEEAMEYVGFHKNYKQELKPINANWGFECILVKQTNILFNDEWNRREIRDLFINEFNKISYEFPLVFFGLNNDRGNVVANFTVEEYENINFHPHEGREGYWFGIPYNIRNTSSISEVKSFIAKAVSSIKNVLNIKEDSDPEQLIIHTITGGEPNDTVVEVA